MVSTFVVLHQRLTWCIGDRGVEKQRCYDFEGILGCESTDCESMSLILVLCIYRHSQVIPDLPKASLVRASLLSIEPQE